MTKFHTDVKQYTLIKVLENLIFITGMDFKVCCNSFSELLSSLKSSTQLTHFTMAFKIANLTLTMLLNK